jgi:HSP20 family molecular chaperone IbpA
MPATQDRIAAEAYETAAELVVRLELPGAVEVDVERATVALQDGTLEIRMPRRDEPRPGGGGLVGFHPDAPPS